MMRTAWWIPVLVAVLFLAFAGWRLTQPRNDFVESAMIGRDLPQFELPAAVAGGQPLTDAAFRDGEPKLLNIWASWCLPCIAEAPNLAELERQGATIVGVAIRDKPEDIAAFLERHGDPFAAVARDDRSRIQLEIGSSGVPETFVIDGTGTITYQHIGEIRPEHVPLLMRELEDAR